MCKYIIATTEFRLKTLVCARVVLIFNVKDNGVLENKFMMYNLYGETYKTGLWKHP
jgi:hypothetical protein